MDIGTGDGRFVYEGARQNPSRFYIGIDASTTTLEKISEKIHRKQSKGGVPNLLLVKASVEDLPEDLTGLADEVHVHFPWGSLLKAVATGNAGVLAGIRRICRADALLEVIIGIDPIKDQTEIARLGIEPITEDFIQQELTVRYANAGFHVTESGEMEPADWPRLCTSWARKLQTGTQRRVFYLIGQAT